jgi:hypothetical protein
MPFTIKTKQKNKVQGSLEHYDSRHFISPPPPQHTHTLRGSIVLNDSKEKEIKREEEEEEVEEEEEGVEEE